MDRCSLYRNTYPSRFDYGILQLKGVALMFKALLRALAILLLLSLPINAQDSGPSMRLDPIVVQRTALPGETFSYTITIENGDRFNYLNMDISMADLDEDINGVYALRVAGSKPHSLSKFVTFDSKHLSVPPGTLKEVTVTVSVPRGISGGRYGAVVFSIQPRNEEDEKGSFGSSLFTFQAVSVLELVVIGAAPKMEAYATSFDVKSSADFPMLRPQIGDSAMVFTTSVTNQGDIHIVTNGRLIIYTNDGRRVAEYPLGGGRGVIIPGATVNMRSIIRKPMPPGEYKAKAIINYGARRPITTEVSFEVKEDLITSGNQEQAPLSRFLVEPQEAEVNLTAGAFKTLVLEVTNRGEKTIELNASIVPLIFDIYGNIIPREERDKETFNWMELNESSLRLNPNQTKRIRLSLRPPKDANGGYYADIIFTSGNEETLTETGISILAFVGDENARKRRGSVKIVNVEKIIDALNIDLIFTNEGTFHVNAAIELILNRIYPQVEAEGGLIIPGYTEKIASVEVPTSENPILPGTERALSFMIPAGLEEGQYELAVRIDYGGDEPAIERLKFNVEGGDSIE
jgi:archaellum component FlaG (FlaF/FlaG flagellin family)